MLMTCPAGGPKKGHNVRPNGLYRLLASNPLTTLESRVSFHESAQLYCSLASKAARDPVLPPQKKK
jgi:hypothetical protein